jgi:hypothetical protein
MLSEAKHLGFVRGGLDLDQSEILRFAQNDTTDWILEYTLKLALFIPFLWQLLFECLHWLEQVALFFDARQRLIGTKL